MEVGDNASASVIGVLPAEFSMPTGEADILRPQQQYPLLAAQSSAITNFAVQMYASDRFITTAIVANICAVIWLAFAAFRPTPAEARSAAAASTPPLSVHCR